MEYDRSLDDIIIQRNLRKNIGKKTNNFKGASKVNFKRLNQVKNPLYLSRRNEPKDEPTTISVSGLAPTVGEEDLIELFMPFGGERTHVRMHYNAQGQPLGSADVIFASGHFAKLAYDTYHDVPLDGYPIRMRMNTNNEAAARPRFTAKSRLGSSFKQPLPHQPKQAQKQNSLPSAEDLDSELDEFMKQSKKICF